MARRPSPRRHRYAGLSSLAALARLAALAALAAASLLACTTSDPYYCAVDSDCRDPARPAFDESRPHCHGSQHFCYEGCARNEDCQDTTRSWHLPGRPYCNLTTGDCEGEAPVVDGGVPDLSLELPTGAACQTAGQCISGYCEDGVCCVDACPGTCMACNLPGTEGSCELVPAGKDPGQDCGSDPGCKGTCNGQGACAYPPPGTTCGADSCAVDTLSESRCNEKGACVTGTLTCGGYVCAEGGGACRSSCEGTELHCTGTFQCVNHTCVNSLPPGAACGTNDAACASGHCTDGVCCAEASCGPCRTCATSGSAGTCTSMPAGPSPVGHCPGDASCGAGQCSGSGACAYLAPGTICSQSCVTGKETTITCDGSHACSQQVEKLCTPYLCEGTTVCKTRCIAHADCVSNSLCHRLNAHLTGAGDCVDPTKVQIMATSLELADAAANMLTSTTKTYLLVPPRPGTDYTKSYTVSSGKTLHLVGAGSPANPVVLDPAPNDVSALAVQAGATLTVQGITVRGAMGTYQGIGINCDGSASSQASLAVVESVLEFNSVSGLSANYCDVSLHRSLVQENSTAGVELSHGAFMITDNVVVQNGSSSVGYRAGFSIMNPTSLTFINNTVAANKTGIGDAAGVRCIDMAGMPLVNSIIWGNTGAPDQTVGCTLISSHVEGEQAVAPSFTADGTYRLQPGSPCINAGDQSQLAGLVLDFSGGPRVKGSQVDQGAYEIQ